MKLGQHLILFFSGLNSLRTFLVHSTSNLLRNEFKNREEYCHNDVEEYKLDLKEALFLINVKNRTNFIPLPWKKKYGIGSLKTMYSNIKCIETDMHCTRLFSPTVFLPAPKKKHQKSSFDSVITINAQNFTQQLVVANNFI